jgi:hypothetical protein
MNGLHERTETGEPNDGPFIPQSQIVGDYPMPLPFLTGVGCLRFASLHDPSGVAQTLSNRHAASGIIPRQIEQCPLGQLPKLARDHELWDCVFSEMGRRNVQSRPPALFFLPSPEPGSWEEIEKSMISAQQSSKVRQGSVCGAEEEVDLRLMGAPGRKRKIVGSQRLGCCEPVKRGPQSMKGKRRTGTWGGRMPLRETPTAILVRTFPSACRLTVMEE